MAWDGDPWPNEPPAAVMFPDGCGHSITHVDHDLKRERCSWCWVLLPALDRVLSEQGALL